MSRKAGDLMENIPLGSDPSEDPGPPATPRWVKMFGLIALLIALAFAVLLVTRGPGGHDPGRHLSLDLDS